MYTQIVRGYIEQTVPTDCNPGRIFSPGIWGFSVHNPGIFGIEKRLNLRHWLGKSQQIITIIIVLLHSIIRNSNTADIHV